MNAPVKAGETYEDWCRVMQIDQIKENNLRPEERDGIVGIFQQNGIRESTASTISEMNSEDVHLFCPYPMVMG